MLYKRVPLNISFLGPTPYAYEQIISSRYSKFLPLFALDVNKMLPNGDFISWVTFSKTGENYKTKNFEYIKTLMHRSAAIHAQYIEARTNGKYTYYIPHLHTLFLRDNELYNSTERVPPVMIFSLVAPSPDRTMDSDLILLVRKDVKIKKYYDLFVNKLIKWYGTQVEVLYVDNIEDYVYVNPLEIFEGLDEISFDDQLKGVIFEPPQERTCC